MTERKRGLTDEPELKRLYTNFESDLVRLINTNNLIAQSKQMIDDQSEYMRTTTKEIYNKLNSFAVKLVDIEDKLSQFSRTINDRAVGESNIQSISEQIDSSMDEVKSILVDFQEYAREINDSIYESSKKELSKLDALHTVYELELKSAQQIIESRLRGLEENIVEGTGNEHATTAQPEDTNSSYDPPKETNTVASELPKARSDSNATGISAISVASALIFLVLGLIIGASYVYLKDNFEGKFTGAPGVGTELSQAPADRITDDEISEFSELNKPDRYAAVVDTETRGDDALGDGVESVAVGESTELRSPGLAEGGSVPDTDSGSGIAARESESEPAVEQNAVTTETSPQSEDYIAGNMGQTEQSPDESSATIDVDLTQEQLYTSRVSGANIRSGPGTNHDIVTVVRSGDKIRDLGERSGRWMKIETEDGKVGWVSSRIIKEYR